MQASDFVFALRQVSAKNTVMVYENFSSIKPLQVEPGKILNNRYGQFHHDALVKEEISSKVLDLKGQSFIRCLSPTPELWTKALHMRTQILYRPDISMIVGSLNVKPGSIVIEAGTGSASLSMALIRALVPSGKLFTFEFNETRAQQAKDEFQSLGLSPNVVSEHRDVIEKGLKHEGYTSVNAIFLDLPNPWELVKEAYEVLAPSGTLCTFSPCIEQVQRNCEAMEKHGFGYIRTIETLSRPLVIRKNEQKLGIYHEASEERLHTGYLTFAHK